MKQFKKINSPDRILNMIQDNLSTALRPLIASDLADAKVLSGITVVTGTNTINHGLGRHLVGWIVCRTSAVVMLYDTQKTNPLTDKNLRLVASGSATISLLVF